MKRVLAFLIAMVIAFNAHAGDPLVREPNAWTDTTGTWAIVKAKPAQELTRWSKYETAKTECPICTDKFDERGIFKAFETFYGDGIWKYWAVYLDIGQDTGLQVDEHSAIIMTVRTKDGIIHELASTSITFPVGWSPLPQHTVRVNTEGTVYVKSPGLGEPTSEDYEWLRLRSEWDGLPKYYVVAYAKFNLEGLDKPEPIGWRADHVTSYRR